MVEKVIQEALKWVGYLEKKNNNSLDSFQGNAGYNNYTIFAQQYKQNYNIDLQGQPWCAMFVSCVFCNALGKKEQESIMPHFHSCITGVQQFKQKGCWNTSNPKRGDVIFFKDIKGVACHTGIIYQVNSSYVYTIEGNTSSVSGVVANGGGVFKKKYKISYNKIMGYGRPKYQTISTPEPWQTPFLNKLIQKGYITDKTTWSKYEEPVTKSLCLALIDKVTGGTWSSSEATTNQHWVQPYVISLCGKGIIENKEEWLNNADAYISKALLLALIDKSTGGTLVKYKGGTYDHWARANLNSLCDKGIITTPTAWCDNFEGWVDKGSLMALLCKAYNL